MSDKAEKDAPEHTKRRTRDSDLSNEKRARTTSESSFDDFLETRLIPGKGTAVCAVGNIVKGQEIVTKGVLWFIKSEAKMKTSIDYEQAYNTFVAKHADNPQVVEDVSKLQWYKTEPTERTSMQDRYRQVFEINGWTHNGGTIVAVATGSFFNHSCQPDFRIWIDAKGQQTMSIMAKRDIAPGREVSVSYLGPRMLQMRVDKRQALLSHWGFYCGCEKCKADTEKLQQRADGGQKTALAALEQLAALREKFGVGSAGQAQPEKIDTIVIDDDDDDDDDNDDNDCQIIPPPGCGSRCAALAARGTMHDDSDDDDGDDCQIMPPPGCGSRSAALAAPGTMHDDSDDDDDCVIIEMLDLQLQPNNNGGGHGEGGAARAAAGAASSHPSHGEGAAAAGSHPRKRAAMSCQGGAASAANTNLGGG